MLGLASSHTPVRQELVVLRFRHCAVPLKTASSVRLTPHREAADKESGSISMGDSEIVCSLLTTVGRLRSDPIGRAPSQVVRSMVERITVSRSTNSVYRSESDPAKLLEQLARIRSLADNNKEALGFLPEAAYREAIEKRRLIAMCAVNNGESEVIGFILFGGVFPNARIQQVAVAKRHQRTGVASALINLVVSQLEMRGYLTITAAIASELTAAQAFYERNGFTARLRRPGGQARNRTIVVRARDLATESLLSIFEQSSVHTQSVVDLGLKRRGASRAPLYAIDLNVMFDVVKAKNRPRSSLAESLMGAALKHQIRLAVAPEFVVELERTSKDENADPILRLARQLPRLPEADRTETGRLTTLIHEIVFAIPSDESTPQALSDCRHLAQSALARASGYITSDGKILASRDRLLEEIGIDVTSLDEFAALLTSEIFKPIASFSSERTV
jgi:ribosomal protein S18 acetylase RimI-like enzyme